MQSDSRKLRGALIGFGFISSKGHLPAYLKRQDVSIEAVADVCEARLEAAKKLIPDARLYPSFEKLLSLEPSLDFIDIATPPCDHAAMALKALQKGLHVLCEKPLTTDTELAQSLLETAKECKRVLFPCHTYKHAPVVKAIRKIIDSGEIGKIHSVSLATFRNTHAKGTPEWQTDWRRFKAKSGGGIAMDHGSHSFYLTFDWLNSYPTQITAKMSCNNPLFDTEDKFSAVLTFPTGTANLELSWVAGVRKVLYCLQGTEGALTIDDDEMQIAYMRKTKEQNANMGAIDWKFQKEKIPSDWMDSSHAGWFNSLFDQFRLAILENNFIGKEIREAFRCVQLIETAYKSANQRCQELELKCPY